MISSKKHVQQLAFLLQAKGVTDIVISPGSRNGPIIHTLTSDEKFTCHSVVDERSAAYFALGLAQVQKRAVAIACSSGTAALNYAPAVAEAFYLNVPLIILTADRPGYWIDQGENQTIPQKNIYRDFCKREITLPLNESEKELWYAARIINETINTAVTGLPGPVHINIPLEEPLHDLLNQTLPPVKVIHPTSTQILLTEEELSNLAAIISQSDKILILPGQMPVHQETEKVLVEFSNKTGAVVLTEHISNLRHPAFINQVDLLMTSLPRENTDAFKPDLLITMGGTFVSKSLRQFLRKNRPQNHWHLSISGQYFDTYQSLTRVVEMNATCFFRQVTGKINSKDDSYNQLWKNKEQQVKQIRDKYIRQTSFCDLSIFFSIMENLPHNSVVHLGNSSPVRYALLCDAAREVEYMGNRGTSGIDGCLSTAVGFASASDKINTVLLGDLSFFYDSNALWNNYIRSNLRIIVIHNGGGNIFSMIRGPGESPAFRQYFFTQNKVSAEGVASAFGLHYLRAENQQELKKALPELYAPHQKKTVLLEIFTDAEQNSKTFRELFRQVKNI